MTRNPACWMCNGLGEENPLTIANLPHSVVRLNRDQYFKGYTFVVYRDHETELYRLSKRERSGFLEEMISTAEALNKVFKPDKMNYELLGNAMPHLHWHLVPRYKFEPLWGQPIWGTEHLERRLSYSEYQKMIEQVRANLG